MPRKIQAKGEGKSEGVVHYEYNGGHVQVAETAPGQSPMYFDYVGGTLNAMEQGGKKTSLLYGVNRVGEVSADGVRHFTLTDQSGSVLSEVLVNPTTHKVSLSGEYAYTPYGVQSTLTVPSNNQQKKNPTPKLKQTYP